MANLISRLIQLLSDEKYIQFIQLIRSEKLKPNTRMNKLMEIARLLQVEVSLLGEYIRDWRNHSSIDSNTMLIILESAYQTKIRYVEVQPTIELSWNGPFSLNSSVTKSIYHTMMEMIKNAQKEIMIVGYSFSSSSELMIEMVNAIKMKANFGCKVWIALHDHFRNGIRFKQLWGDGPPFEMYYWNIVEENVSLHAKMLLIDEEDFFITSANLTDYGMSKNIEIGLRYTVGEIPIKMKQQFLSLVDQGILVKY